MIINSSIHQFIISDHCPLAKQSPKNMGKISHHLPSPDVRGGETVMTLSQSRSASSWFQRNNWARIHVASNHTIPSALFEICVSTGHREWSVQLALVHLSVRCTLAIRQIVIVVKVPLLVLDPPELTSWGVY